MCYLHSQANFAPLGASPMSAVTAVLNWLITLSFTAVEVLHERSIKHRTDLESHSNPLL